MSSATVVLSSSSYRQGRAMTITCIFKKFLGSHIRWITWRDVFHTCILSLWTSVMTQISLCNPGKPWTWSNSSSAFQCCNCTSWSWLYLSFLLHSSQYYWCLLRTAHCLQLFLSFCVLLILAFKKLILFILTLGEI